MGCSLGITPAMKQTWLVIPVLLHKTGTGMVLGSTSAKLAALQASDSDITVDVQSSSWLVSSVPLACIIGVFTASIAMSKYGRRLSFLIHSVPAVVGTIICYFASDVASLIIGRVLIGITVGGNVLTGIINVGECTSPQNRSMFLNISTASFNIGSLIVHTIGYYVTWRVLVVIVGFPYFLCFLMAYSWPESPAWLAERKQYEKSRTAFYWLRGKTEETTKEIEELIRVQDKKKDTCTRKEKVLNFFHKFKKKNFLKPLFVICTALLLLETGGRHFFPAYAAQLIKEISPGGFQQSMFNIVIDSLVVASGFAASYLVKIMRVRTLLFSSGVIAFTALCITSLTLYMDKAGTMPEGYSLISIVLFSVYFIIANLGCTWVPVVLKGEIFPQEHRSVLSFISFVMTMLLTTLFLKQIPILIVNIQIYGAFAVLALIMGISLLILYFTLPETKDRTLLEIENYFTYGTFRDGDVLPTDDKDNVTINLNES